MNGAPNERPLAGVTASVITVSDSVVSKERKDESGPEAIQFLEQHGATVAGSEDVPDEKAIIAERLRWWVRDPSVDLVVTTGGTGVSPRDVTPEATEEVCDRLIPGLAELMRSVSLEKTPHAALSRAVVGVSDTTIIVNLPGSPGGVKDGLTAIASSLSHAVNLAKGEPTKHRQT